MRTYEEVRDGLIKDFNYHIGYQKGRFESPQADEFDKEIASSVIKECESYLANIDEVAVIEIGALTTNLIEAIQKFFGYDIGEYYSNFDAFMKEYIMGIANPEKPTNGYKALAGEGECLRLGISLEDLRVFKGHNPLEPDVIKTFIDRINNNYGTKIPYPGALEDAMKNYSDTIGKSSEEQAEALLALRDVQKNSGFLKNGGTYYIEANDKALQAAKTTLEGASRK